MLRLSRFAPWWIALGWCSACAKPLTETECERLLDHYTEQLIRSERAAPSPQLISEKQAAARALAKSDSRFEFAACADDVSRKQFECALSAPSVDGIERCLVL